MSKKKAKPVQSTSSVDTGRGVIKDNALAALVTSKVFKPQIVSAKKGKGAYKRKSKHSGQESYLIAA
ncbi:MAG: alternative ribosome rescue factor ArfA [Pseudoalteromonas sp.]|uniref:alternative ribosome rescue factor ArfA n=1 Tax=unclassified Pseudoalteromonas TaxID=194690 RepID=UPI003F9B3F2B